MDDMGLRILEQKVLVMQNEISQVLGEMQSTIQAIAKTYSIALKVAMERLDRLEASEKAEKAVGTLGRSDDGKEL